MCYLLFSFCCRVPHTFWLYFGIQAHWIWNKTMLTRVKCWLSALQIRSRSRTHWVTTAAIVIAIIVLLHCTGLHSAHPIWTMWTYSHTFIMTVSSFHLKSSMLEYCAKTIENNVTMLTGCTVCAQTCLLPGEAEEGGSDACMNKGCVWEDWLSTLNTWQIKYRFSQSSYNDYSSE